MSFSHYAGVAIVPTLSRIVLATAFITAGYKKVFTDAEYTLDESKKLQSWNITVTPVVPTVATAWPRGGRELQWEVVPASFRQTIPAATAPALKDPAPDPSPAATPQATQPEAPQATQPAAPETTHQPAPAPETAHQPEPTPQPAPTETTHTVAIPAGGPTTAPAATMYTATSMWKVALMLDNARWPQPKTQAWLAAFTELGGGALILLGLFSRVWGLGLSFVMGVAFYFTSLPALQAHGWNPNALPFSDFATLITQLPLFVLAFGILLTGPGPLSIDRILFGGPREDVDVVEVKRERA